MRNFAVIGLGRFGFSVARTLSENGAQVLAIDKDFEKIQEVRDIVTQAVQMNALDEKTTEVMLCPTKAIKVTFDGTDPVTAGHGVIVAADERVILGRAMAQALKLICAVATETGTVSAQELGR